MSGFRNMGDPSDLTSVGVHLRVCASIQKKMWEKADEQRKG